MDSACGCLREADTEHHQDVPPANLGQAPRGLQARRQKTMIDEPEGGAIESVTSNPDALEGNRPTLVILNEIQWWREANQGTEMYQKIVGNQVKRASAGARYLAICNAHRPGEESVGERLWDAHRKVLAGEA